MEHRGIKYDLVEWRTWNNLLARAYKCNDAELLEGLPTKSFQSFSKDEMIMRIDDYLDNKDYLLHIQSLNEKAIQSTYEKDNYQLD